MLRAAGNFRYLLVQADSFSGWIEAFPDRTETAAGVAKALLKEIILRFGFPESLQSNNGPAFVSLANECPGHKTDLAVSLEIPVIGKMRSNQTLVMLCQEAQENWIKLLLIALLRMQLAPGG